MARLLLAAVGLSSTALLWFSGCSGSTFTEGSNGAGNGGSATAGAQAGGSESTAGSASGGSGVAGSSVGGMSAAGTSSGGTAAGGSATGGAGSGGTSSGGTASGGGDDGGSCMQDSDCVECQYSGSPTKAADCCTNCNWKPMSKQECDAHRAVYDKFCANLHPLCPAIACVQPPDVRCTSGMCVAGNAR